MRRRIRKMVIGSAAGLLLCFAALVVFFYALSHHPGIQDTIRRKISQLLMVEIDSGQIRLHFSRTIAVGVEKISVASHDGKWSAEASEAVFFFDLFSLFKRQFVPKRVRILSPMVKVHPAPGQPSGPSDLSGIDDWFRDENLQRLEEIEIEEGALYASGWGLAAESLSLTLKRAPGKDVIHLSLDARARTAAGDAIPITITGVLNTADAHAGETFLDVRLASSDFSLKAVPWPSMLDGVRGKGPARLHVTGPVTGPLHFTGNADISDAALSLSWKDRVKPYALPRATVRLEGSWQPGALELNVFSLDTLDTTLSGSMRLETGTSEGTLLRLDLETTPMALGTFKALYPDPLTHPWLVKTLFPVFSSGKARLERLRLDGPVSRIKRMKLPENTSVFSIQVAVEDLSAFGGDWGPALDAVSGSVEVDKGRLFITGVQGKAGVSRLYDGSLVVPDLYRHSGTGRIEMKGDLDLADTLRFKSARYVPMPLRAFMAPISGLTGKGAARVEIAVSEKWKKIVWQSGDMNVSEASVRHESIPGTLEIDKSHLQFETAAGASFTGSGTLETAPVRLSGEISPGWNQARIEAEMDLFSTETLTRFYPAVGGRAFLSRTVPCRGSIHLDKNSSDTLKGFCKTQGLTVTAGGFKLSPMSPEAAVHFSLNREGVSAWRIEDLLFTGKSGQMRVQLPEGKWDGSGALGLTATDMDLNELGLFFPDATAPIEGRLTGKWSIPFGSRPFKDMTGHASIRNGVVPPFFSPYGIRTVEGEISFSSGNLAVQKGRIESDAGDVSLEGKLKLGEKITGKLTAKSLRIDLNTALSPLESPRESKGSKKVWKNAPGSYDIQLAFATDTLIWKHLEIADAGVRLSFKEDGTRLDSGRGRFPGGELRFSGRLNPENQLAVSVHATVHPQPLESLAARLQLSLPKLRGTVSGEGLFYTSGSGMEAWVRNLIGTANIEILDGFIEKSSIIIKILDFLSLQNIFIKRPPAETADEFYFQQIQGDIEILGSLLKTEHILLKSPVFNAVAAGEIDWAKDRIDMKVGTQPLGTIDFLISKIPILGHILTGKQKSLLVYYFHLKGSLKNPDVQHVPFESLGKNFTGYIERLLFTPARLFKQFNQMIRFLTNQGAEVIPEE